MSASTASACDAEPTLRAFILGSLEDAPNLPLDEPELFPDLEREIDEADLDLSGICAWLEASTEPGVAPDAPRCASPERDDASFFRDLLEEPPRSPRAAKRRRTRDDTETTLGGADASARESTRDATCVTRKSSDESSRDDSANDEKSRTSARLRRNRESAAASRARKKNETAALRRTVRELERANAHLSYAAQCAFAENAALRCRLGFGPPQNVVGPPAPTEPTADPSKSFAAGPGFPEPPARPAERDREKPEATEPAALERFDFHRIEPLPVMPSDDDIASSSRASLRTLKKAPFSRFAPRRDGSSGLRLGALRLVRRRSRASRVAMWDAVVDARVSKRGRDRRGDGAAETRRREERARFPEPRDARLRALSAPRRAARIGTRAFRSMSRLRDAQPPGGSASVAQTPAASWWDTSSSRRS